MALAFLLVALPAWAAPPDAPASGARPVLSWSGLDPEGMAFVARAALLGLPSRDVEPSQARKVLSELLETRVEPGTFEGSAVARALAEGAVALQDSDPALAGRMAGEATRLVGPLDSWMEDFGKFAKVHGIQEPVWVHGRPDVLAQAVLAWISLDEVHSDPGRRERIRRGAEGLKSLLRGSFSTYPFGAHLSAVTAQGRPRTYVAPGTGNPVAGLSWVVERNQVVAALSRAGQLLGDSTMLESAEREGLGLLAHLAVSGRIPYGFAPRPEFEASTPRSVAAVVENLATLHQAVSRPVFSDLTGLAAARLQGEGPLFEASRLLVARMVARAGASRWVGARDLRPAFGTLVVEAEDGRAVEKAFEAVPIRYPGGTPGKLAVVGRENMFWMRFDVDREDEYLFYLAFLKSEVSGGLVSVMMRIDGDRIFQVNLGGASDDPYVDVDLVAGPRRLRQGPHSFGIRFSGLLMRQPAVLDSVIVQPAVARRWMTLRDGREILALKGLNSEPLRIRMEELEAEGEPPTWNLVSGMGNPIPAKLSTDRRGRVWLEMPPGGLAFLEWTGSIPGVERLDEEAMR